MATTEPVKLALLFCDTVIDEKNTSKKTIVGTFTSIHGRNFPLQFRPFWVYVSFTNLEGEHKFTLNIVQETTKTVVVSMGGEIKTDSLKAVVELPLPIRGLVIPEPGEYSAYLYLDGEPFWQRTLLVNQIGG